MNNNIPSKRINIKLDGFGEHKDKRITVFDDNEPALKLLESFLKNVGNKSTQTAVTYFAFLRGFLFHISQLSLTLDQVTHDDCQSYIDYYISKNGKRDNNGNLIENAKPDVVPMFSAVRRLFRWYLAHGIIETDPTALIEVKSPDRDVGATKPITMADVDRMLENCKTLEKHKHQASRDRCLIMTLSRTGLRITALLGCLVSDVGRLKDGYGTLSVTEKGNKVRLVPLIPIAMQYIEDHIEICKLKPADPLFQRIYRGDGLSGKAVSRDGTRKMLIKRAAAAGITADRITNHTFRATFATEYLNEGGDIAFARDMMGHSSVDITSRYDHRDIMDIAHDICKRLG